jgi:hypothetical protein
MSNFQVTEYSPIVAVLADLETRHKNAEINLTTKAGIAAARKAIDEIIDSRLELERLRIRLRTTAAERVRVIDEEAKTINRLLCSLGEPIQDAIRIADARLAAGDEAITKKLRLIQDDILEERCSIIDGLKRASKIGAKT